MPVAISQLNVNPKQRVINLTNPHTANQLIKCPIIKPNKHSIFISPFLSNLPVYANINSPGYLNIHDMGNPFLASPHICKSRSICQSRPLYKYPPLIFPPFKKPVI